MGKRVINKYYAGETEPILPSPDEIKRGELVINDGFDNELVSFKNDRDEIVNIITTKQINSLLQKKQNVYDENLNTENKEIVSSINEVLEKIKDTNENLENNINNIQSEINDINENITNITDFTNEQFNIINENISNINENITNITDFTNEQFNNINENITNITDSTNEQFNIINENITNINENITNINKEVEEIEFPVTSVNGYTGNVVLDYVTPEELEKKQDKEDELLETEDKTVVGGINELNETKQDVIEYIGATNLVIGAERYTNEENAFTKIWDNNVRWHDSFLEVDLEEGQIYTLTAYSTGKWINTEQQINENEYVDVFLQLPETKTSIFGENRRILKDGRFCMNIGCKITGKYKIYFESKPFDSSNSFWQIQIEKGEIPSSWKYPETALAKQSDLTNLSIGVTNLIVGAEKYPDKDNAFSFTANRNDDYSPFPQLYVKLNMGKVYTFTAHTDGLWNNVQVISSDYDNPESHQVDCFIIHIEDGVNTLIYPTNEASGNIKKVKMLPDGRLCSTFIAPKDGDYCIRFDIDKNDDTQKFWQVQIEEGEIPSSWSCSQNISNIGGVNLLEGAEKYPDKDNAFSFTADNNTQHKSPQLYVNLKKDNVYTLTAYSNGIWKGVQDDKNGTDFIYIILESKINDNYFDIDTRIDVGVTYTGGVILKKRILNDGRVCITFTPTYDDLYYCFLGIKESGKTYYFYQIQIEEGEIPSSWKYPETALAKQSDLTSLTNKVTTNTNNITTINNTLSTLAKQSDLTTLTNKVNTNTNNITTINNTLSTLAKQSDLTSLTNKVNTNTKNISDLDNKKQDKSDNQLKTSVQTVVGGINELKERIDSISIAVPVGSIQIWPGNSEPNGYKICNGATLNKDEYDSLFKVIGYTYGGNGDVFQIPNMQGRFVAGKDGNYYNSLGKTGGESYVTLTAAQSGLPAHTHSASGYWQRGHHTLYGGSDKYPQVTKYNTLYVTENDNAEIPVNVTVKSTGGTGATVAHENRPPFIVMNYIIKVK